MLLTEHKEQYDKRGESGPVGRPTIDELKMIRDYIMFPHMLTMTDKAFQEITKSNHLFKRYYAELTQLILDDITKDLSKLRRELRSRNIKVEEDETRDDIFYYKYFCRGYQDTFSIVRELLRSEIAARLALYSSKIMNRLRQDAKG